MRHPDDGREVTSGSGASGSGGASGDGDHGAPHPDEGTIHAWLDGELPEAEARTLSAHLEGCAGCRDAVAEARGLVAASARIVRALDDGPGGLHARPAASPPATAAVPDRPAAGSAPGAPGVPGAASAGGDVRPIEVARARRSAGTTRRWRLPAIAAVGLLAVGTTLVVQRGGPLAPLTQQGATAAATEARSEAPAAASPSEARESADRSGMPGAAERSAAPAAPAAVAADARSAAPTVAAPLPVTPPLPPRMADAAPADRAVRQDSVVAQGATALAAPAAAGGVAARRFSRPETAGAAAPAVVMPPSAEVPRAVGPVLTGRVVTDAGRPVASARVTLPGVGQAVVTDSQGRFRIAGVPTGEHLAVVRGPGFEPRRLPLHVVPVGDSVVTVVLEPERPAPEQLAGGAEPSRRAVAARAAAPAITTAPPLAAPAPAPAPQPPAPTVEAPPAPPAAGAAATALARRLAGCYRLELGGEASAGRDSAEVALPGWLHLLATPSVGRAGWLRVEPLLPAGLPASGSTGWRLGVDDEVEIVWPAAEAGNEVVLRLRGAGEVLTGTAALRRSGGGAGGEREAASVVAFRGACAR